MAVFLEIRYPCYPDDLGAAVGECSTETQAVRLSQRDKCLHYHLKKLVTYDVVQGLEGLAYKREGLYTLQKTRAE